MKRRTKLSASVMCADLLNLERDLNVLKKTGFDYIHFDLMDGHFVPEVGLGTFFLEQLTQKQSIPVDVHLMVTRPQRFIAEIAAAGAAMVIFHYEVIEDAYYILQTIKRYDLKAGIALRPFTPIEVVSPCLDHIDLVLLMAYAPGIRNQSPLPDFSNRIEKLNNLLVALKREDIDIAVDGGVTEDKMAEYNDCGANFMILGSSGLFIPNTDLEAQITKIKNILRI